MLVVMFIIGLNQGTQPIIGFNFGAGNFERMFKTLRLGVMLACVFTLLGFIIGTFFPYQIVKLFTSDIDLQNISGSAIILSLIFMRDLPLLFGGTQNTVQYAYDYMIIIIPGGIFTALYFGLNNILRASG